LKANLAERYLPVIEGMVFHLSNSPILALYSSGINTIVFRRLVVGSDRGPLAHSTSNASFLNFRLISAFPFRLLDVAIVVDWRQDRTTEQEET
jgi:hypothetical protein